MGLFDDPRVKDFIGGAMQGALLGNAIADPEGQMRYVLPSLRQQSQDQFARDLEMRKLKLEEERTEAYKEQLGKKSESERREHYMNAIHTALNNMPDAGKLMEKGDYNAIGKRLSTMFPAPVVQEYMKSITPIAKNIVHDNDGNFFGVFENPMGGLSVEQLGKVPWADAEKSATKLLQNYAAAYDSIQKIAETDPQKADLLRGQLFGAAEKAVGKDSQVLMQFLGRSLDILKMEQELFALGQYEDATKPGDQNAAYANMQKSAFNKLMVMGSMLNKLGVDIDPTDYAKSITGYSLIQGGADPNAVDKVLGKAKTDMDVYSGLVELIGGTGGTGGGYAGVSKDPTGMESAYGNLPMADERMIRKPVPSEGAIEGPGAGSPGPKPGQQAEHDKGMYNAVAEAVKKAGKDPSQIRWHNGGWVLFDEATQKITPIRVK